jgi:hypothetical protein
VEPKLLPVAESDAPASKVVETICWTLLIGTSLAASLLLPLASVPTIIKVPPLFTPAKAPSVETDKWPRQRESPSCRGQDRISVEFFDICPVAG